MIEPGRKLLSGLSWGTEYLQIKEIENENYHFAVVQILAQLKLHFTSITIQTNLIHVIKTLKEIIKKGSMCTTWQNGQYHYTDMHNSSE